MRHPLRSTRALSAMPASLRVASFLLLLLPGCATSIPQKTIQSPSVRNIVLVHGAWADGSGWRGVYDILVRDGYNVSIVQQPETTFAQDVAATQRVLAQLDGPCVLVAHSY